MPYIGAMDIVSRKPIKRAVESHYTGDVRIMNDDALGAYLLKSLVSKKCNSAERSRSRK